MKIKDYKCTKCKRDDFKAVKSNMHTGIYCTYCGSFFKWASKDEKKLFEMNEDAGESI